MLQKIIKSRTVICILAVLLSIGFCRIGLAAETPGFLPFAINSRKVDVLPGGEGIITEPTAVVEESPIQTPDEKKPGFPGFSFFAGVFVLLIAVQILRKKK